MKRPDELKTSKKLQLKVISPVHIGSREGSLRAMEFVFHGGQVYLVDEERLGEELYRKGSIPRLIEAVQHGRLSMADFLNKLGGPPAKLLDRICRRKITGGESQMQEFRPLIRDGQGAVFLPGSAIKGVFRTAILYKLLQAPEWSQKIENHVRRQSPCQGTGREKRQKTVFFSEDLLQKQGLQNFKLPWGDKATSNDPTTDILRCLTVRDAYPIDPEEVRNYVVPVDFLSKGKAGFYFSEKRRSQGPLRVWIEAIFQGKFLLEVVWNREIFKQFQAHNREPFPITDLDELLSAVHSMNQDLIEHEKSHFAPLPPPTASTLAEALKVSTDQSQANQAALSLRDFYNKRRGNYLRLGFGSGLLSTTVNLRLPPELRQKVRDHCGSGPRPGEVAPKSRRVWANKKGQYFPLGWLALTELQ